MADARGIVASRPRRERVHVEADGGARRADVARAIIEAVAYADVFDWPLTPDEVHRFLPIPADRAEVGRALDSTLIGGSVRSFDGHVVSLGREALVAERRRRAAISARRWPEAIRSARAVAGLPFVRFVAVTGSLAAGAADDDADVDLFVVTADGRLWLTRAMTVAIVRLAAARGTVVCPNYFLAESATGLPERDVFTAHEYVQMVPIAGDRAYAELVDRNAWYHRFLPNHPGPPPPGGAPRLLARRVVEWLLRARPVDRLERWEMDRKIARLGAGALPAEARFDRTTCKGHLGAHRERTLAALRQRLDRTTEPAR